MQCMPRKATLTALALLAVAGGARAQLTISPSATAFVDISVTGTSVGTIGDDTEHIVAGATHNWVGNQLFAGGFSFLVGNNGAMLWGTSATDAFTTATEVGFYNPGPNNSTASPNLQKSIATMTASNTGSSGNGNGIRQLIAPLWDDYIPNSGATTNVRWQVVGADLIVQWSREAQFTSLSTGGDVTFEAIFRGNATLASGLPLVEFVYNDTLFAASKYQNDGGSATIGYKNWGVFA